MAEQAGFRCAKSFRSSTEPHHVIPGAKIIVNLTIATGLISNMREFIVMNKPQEKQTDNPEMSYEVRIR